MITRTAVILVVLAAAIPVDALAQTPGAPVAATLVFAPPVKIGQNVWVTNAQGAETRGKVGAVSSTGIDLDTVVGAKHFAPTDVWMIHKKDSNKQGFLIGAAVGLVGGWSAGSMISAVAPRGVQRAFFAFGIVSYAGIGALIDNAIAGREIVYHRPESNAAAVISITPIVGLNGSKRLGVGGSITWK